MIPVVTVYGCSSLSVNRVLLAAVATGEELQLPHCKILPGGVELVDRKNIILNFKCQNSVGGIELKR